MVKKAFFEKEELMTKANFDKKINIDNQIGSDPNSNLSGSGNWSDIFGVDTGSSDNTRQNLLRLGQTSKSDFMYGGNSSAIFFGAGDTKGGLEVHWADHVATIVGGNNPRMVWSEHIAWKSDVERLQDEIDQLKKQIGGVKLNYRLYYATSKEVA